MPNKYAHVKGASLSTSSAHGCAWPGCPVQVPRARWGCKAHWLALPLMIRTRIWDAYTMGQENDPALVSDEYLDAASAAQRWIDTYRRAADQSSRMRPGEASQPEDLGPGPLAPESQPPRR
jgi:hypothetical protein